jgi:very-short-patch-repair endonuclease
MCLDHAVRKHAEQQHGLITRQQLRALGASSSAVSHRLAVREWIAISPQVLRLNGAPSTVRQSALAAVLDTGSGSWLSHQAAAALWGLPGFTMAPHHVSRPRTGTRRTRRLAIVHYPGRMPVDHLAVLDGIPVSSPTRVLYELAGTIHPARLERLVDTAWARRLVTPDSLRSSLIVLGRRGRPGIAAMRQILQARGSDYRPAESGLERRFEQILANDGQAPMERQVDLGDGDGWIGRVDFLDREARVVVEVQSQRFHAALTDRRADEARVAALSEAGFDIVTVWDNEIWHEPRAVAARIRRVRERGRTR